MTIKKDPIKATVKSAAHTSPYKVHKYYARRPHNVFRNLIEHYSDEGDIVLDVFCGGGVTLYEGLTIKRKVVGVDLNPLATFISEMQIQKIDPLEFKNVATKVLKKIEYELSYVYSFKSEDKLTLGEFEWIEWAYEVECPECGHSITLSEENKVSNGFYKCENSDCETNKEENPKIKRIDCKPIGSRPIKGKVRDGTVHLFSNKEKVKLSNFVTELEEELIADSMIKVNKAIPVNWDRTNEDKLFEKGVTNFKDFFTPRNYAINTVIFNKIISLKEDQKYSKYLIDLLYYSFSASLRHTNNMTRVTKNWENGNPTSMDKHAYWLPNQYVETNVFVQWEKKIKALVKALDYTQNKMPDPTNKLSTFKELVESDNGHMVLTQSSSDLPIPDSSIDVIITDPPYGSNVQYNELSSFWNVWYEHYKGKEVSLVQNEEAVMNRKKNFEGSKSVDHYEDMLFQIFQESYRVLKNNSYLVFTFNNKNMNVWFALLRAAARAGFVLPADGVVFQDYIKSYKNTSHLRFDGNIQGDFIYSFQKVSIKGNEKGVINNEEIDSVLKNEIEDIVEDLFKEKNKHTTAELYQAIFSGVIHVMMEVAKKSLVDDDELKQVEKKSDSYIDQILNSLLFYDGEYWFKKEE